MTLHVSVDTGCNLACSYSMVAGTRVLTADLEWVNVEELGLDDEVVSFDSPKDREKNEHLSLNTNKITACWRYKEGAVKVVTDKGEITVGETHPFLTKHHGWRDAKNFKKGQQIRHIVEPENYEKNDKYWNGYACGAFAGDGSVYSNDTTKVATLRCQDSEIGESILDNAPVSDGWGLENVGTDSNGLHEIRTSVWAEVDRVDSYLPVYDEWCDDEDYKRGWLAGIFDTDGSFDGQTVRFNQYQGEVKDYIKTFLEDLGYEAVVEEKSIRVREGYGGKFEILTEIRPQVSRKVRNYEGRAWKGQATVRSVERVGERTFYDVTVENDHTLIAEGLCSHNCYEQEDRVINGNDVTNNYDMEAIMDQLEDMKERYPQEVPGLHGGEPLLLRDEDIETIFEWVYNNYESVREAEEYSHIQTNATLLRDKHIEIFDKYNVNVGISCDGPPELNEHRKAAMREEATDRLSGLTYENIFKLGESSVPVGVIVVLHKGNAGTEEKLETLHEWMDELNKNGITGHFNEMLPYEDIEEDLTLSGERMKEIYLETWEWMKEEPYRSWNPMRQFQDNLLGNEVSDCRVAKCDVFDAGAAKVVDGEGETTGCFDSKTEILTGDGWKFFEDATVEDMVATVNPETQELEFHTPIEKQAYQWDGEMLHWETRAMDCMVTPDHNMYTSNRNHDSWWRVEAKELAQKSEPYFKKAPKGIREEGTKVPDVEDILPETTSNGTRNLTKLKTDDIDLWVRFLAWYIAEGHSHEESYTVTITQDSEYTEEVIELLDSLGPTVIANGYEWTVSSKQIYEMVEGLGLCDEKYVPEWVKNLPKEKIELFLEVLFKGDGTSHHQNDQDKDEWVKYTTTSRKLANDVQELLLRIGKGGSISIQEKPTKGGKTRYDISVVHHVDKTRVTEGPERVEYSGKVYDFTVPPNHTLLVRRKGRVFVTGNCGKTWPMVGDGSPFLQGPSNGSEYNDDEDRERILKSLPGAPETDGPDLGGCKGCRYWKVCYDDETEVLTSDGWKYFEDISLGDEVATLNQDSHEIEFHNPIAKQTPEYNGKMIEWSGSTYNLCVTPDHNVFARSSPNQPFENHTAEEIENNSALSFKRGGEWAGKDYDAFTPEPAKLDEGAIHGTPSPINRSFDAENWFKFMGWYLAEGSINRKKTGNHRVTICQEKEEYREEIISLLEDMGFSVYAGEKNIEFDSKQIVNHLQVFGHSSEKYVPEYIMNASTSLIRVFLREYAKGDGTLRDNDTPRIIYTSSEVMADCLQELGLKANWPSTKGVDDRKDKGRINGKKVKASDVYHVTFAPQQEEVEVWVDSERKEYEGTVYDLTVPNHTMYVRRGGKTLWSGNCHGGCPSAGMDEDHRNRTRWCDSKYYLYKRIEEDMRTMFPNITLVTDLPWDARTQDLAQSGQLDIGQFDAMNSQGDGKKKSAYGGYEKNKPQPEEMIPEERMPEMTQERMIENFEEKHGEENVTSKTDGDEVILHADSDMENNDG